MTQYFIPAALSLLVTLLGGLILWRIKKEKLSLQYALIESGTFPRENGEGSYFVIRLKNNGNKAIENIAVNIAFDLGSIETIRFSDKKLLTDFRQEDAAVNGTIPLLNPKEDLDITITAVGATGISTPKITARAIGVTAVEAREIELSFRSFIWAIAFVTSLIAAITMYVVVNHKMERIEVSKEELRAAIKEAEKKEAPDREDKIFAILNSAGLCHVYPQLMSIGSEITYRNTGFFLLHLFLIESDSNKQKIVSAMENLAQVEDVYAPSRSTIYYLLAKMEQTRGNHSKATAYLQKSKDAAPLIYDHLMAQDPSYDLQSLKKWLLIHRKS